MEHINNSNTVNSNQFVDYDVWQVSRDNFPCILNSSHSARKWKI